MDPTVIVIPTYNERECLPTIVPAVRAAVPAASVLIVDDSSPDGTGALADEMAAADPQVQVLHRAGKEGLGAAYLAAFAHALAAPAGWQRIVQMDADFSHDPADVPRLLAALDAGADLAVGSRYVAGGGTENWGLGRRIISRGGALYARTTLGVGVQDLTAGFKAWKADTLRWIDVGTIESNGYSFQVEMNYRTVKRGLRIAEVPIRFEERTAGASKMSLKVQLESALMPWKLLFSRS